MTNEQSKAGRQLEQNIAVHDRIAWKYDRHHDEIFNPREQTRLRTALVTAKHAIEGRHEPYKALDFGSGSGNLTSHLLALGTVVTAADVSRGFLDLVARRFAGDRIELHQLNGSDLREIPDESFDLIATYSVLHHIPDYLAAIDELARVCVIGGVVYLDHEQNEEYWRGSTAYRELQKKALRTDWKKFLRSSNYFHKLRRLFDPRHTNEGDIHVWPDDHIEWDSIRALLLDRGFEIVVEEDYLLFRGRYRPEVFDRFVGKCTDTKMMIARKLPR